MFSANYIEQSNRDFYATEGSFDHFHARGMGAYFCHHLSDNDVDLSDLYVDLSAIYDDLSDHNVDLSEKYHHN